MASVLAEDMCFNLIIFSRKFLIDILLGRDCGLKFPKSLYRTSEQNIKTIYPKENYTKYWKIMLVNGLLN